MKRILLCSVAVCFGLWLLGSLSSLAAAAEPAQPGVLGIKLVPSLSLRPRVADVTPGGPADEAGLWPGDVITAINGQTLTNYHDLIRVVRAQPAGTVIRLDVIREQESGELRGQLQARLVTAAQMTAIENQARINALPEASRDSRDGYQSLKSYFDSLPYND